MRALDSIVAMTHEMANLGLVGPIAIILPDSDFERVRGEAATVMSFDASRLDAVARDWFQVNGGPMSISIERARPVVNNPEEAARQEAEALDS